MKKLFITVAFFTGLVSLSFAQQKTDREKKTPEQRAQQMTDALDKKLSLTADQKSKIYQINLDRAKNMEKMHSEAQAERKQKFEKRKALMEESDKKFENILNADQRKAYQQLKAERKEKMKAHHNGRHGKSDGSQRKRL